MEESAIRDGFENLKPGSNYDSLYQSALCRQQADWLVGLNGTRLFTVLYGGKGFKGFQRGEYGSTAEHLTSLQYQIKQDKHSYLHWKISYNGMMTK